VHPCLGPIRALLLQTTYRIAAAPQGVAVPVRLWLVALLLAAPLAAGVASRSSGPEADSTTPVGPLASLERQTHAKVNAYRSSIGLAGLKWDDSVAQQARRHSRDMASGASAFGHDGFDARMHDLVKSVAWTGVAENVFMLLNLSDPAAVAVNGWIDSPGHRHNIEGDYNLTGIGIARAEDGSLYFTQIFVKSKAARE
jgi:uncharacterized protein YkwD